MHIFNIGIVLSFCCTVFSRVDHELSSSLHPKDLCEYVSLSQGILSTVLQPLCCVRHSILGKGKVLGQAVLHDVSFNDIHMTFVDIPAQHQCQTLPTTSRAAGHHSQDRNSFPWGPWPQC